MAQRTARRRVGRKTREGWGEGQGAVWRKVVEDGGGPGPGKGRESSWYENRVPRLNLGKEEINQTDNQINKHKRNIPPTGIGK